MSLRHFTSEDADWYQYRDREIFVGDVLNSTNSETMTLTVRSAEGTQTARAGEVIFLTKGTRVAYEAGEDNTEVVYVTYPHWMDVHRQSEHAALLDDFHPPI